MLAIGFPDAPFQQVSLHSMDNAFSLNLNDHLHIRGLFCSFGYPVYADGIDRETMAPGEQGIDQFAVTQTFLFGERLSEERIDSGQCLLFFSIVFLQEFFNGHGH